MAQVQAFDIGDSAATLSELRDCLAPILTTVAIARSLSVNAKQDAALQILERQALRLAHLIEEGSGGPSRALGGSGGASSKPVDDRAH